MEGFEIPKGAVKFAMGSYDKLPKDVVEVKVYMRSGDPKMYIVPIQKNESKIEIEPLLDNPFLI